MRYKGFYIKISPDSNIRRVDKKGRDILCEGFLIQVFADETERVEIDNFSAAVGFEILENSFAEAVQFAKDYVECEEKLCDPLAHGLDQRNDERIPHGEIAQSFRHPGCPIIREAVEPFAFDGR